MGLKRYLLKFSRGWVPKEHVIYSVKRWTITHRGLAIYFSLVFVVGIILRLFIEPLFLSPNVTETIDITILSFIFMGGMLALIYYLKTRGSPNQVRLFYLIGIGGGLGFPIWVVAMLLSKAITGYYVDGVGLQLTYALSFLAAFIIAIPTSKGLQKRFPARI